MPFTAPLSRAAQRYGQQATDIAQTASTNIGNIIMGIAQAKARGVQEGSRAWANMLQQLGVTAQQWPMIRRQMEEYEARKEASQYAISLRPEEAESRRKQRALIEAQTAETQAQADERKAKGQAYSSWLKWRTLPPEKRGELPPEAANLETEFQDNSNKARTLLATADKAEYDKEIAKWDTAHKIASASIARLESYPEDTNETTLRADIANTFKEIRKTTPGVLPEGLVPQLDWFTLGHLKIFAKSAGERAGVKREPEQTAEEATKGLDLAIRTTVNLKTPAERTKQLDFLLKTKKLDEGTRAIFPPVDSPNWVEEVKALGKQGQEMTEYQQRVTELQGRRLDLQEKLAKLREEATVSGKPLTPAQAQSFLRLVNTQAKSEWAIQEGDLSESEIAERIVAGTGYSYSDLLRMAAGVAPGKEAEKPTATPAQAAGKKLEVTSPDGQRGFIPEEDWPQAQKEGYRLVK